jgi:hypothetical protein
MEGYAVTVSIAGKEETYAHESSLLTWDDVLRLLEIVRQHPFDRISIERIAPDNDPRNN